MNFFQFIKSRYFFRNLAIAIAVLIVLIAVIFNYLSSYTLHGETVPVPDFNEIKLAELDAFIADKNVRYTIIDSIYDTKKPKGTVVDQDPAPGVPVKQGRTIYLYVTSTVPPKVNMPKLIDRSLRQASAMIEAYGLKQGRIKFVPDQCANCVLEQMHKGKKIKAGELIEKNAVIDLVVGKGLGDEEVAVPYLIGLSRKQALEKLMESSLSEGVVKYDNPKDSLISKVYRQLPGPSKENYVNMGTAVDLFLTADESKITTIPDTAATTNQAKPE